MTVRIFVDTNVLVYRHDASSPVKQSRADDWYRLLWRQRSGRLSYQVLQELYSALTRKLKPGLDAAKAQQIVRALAAWRPMPVNLSILERAWSLQSNHAVSWWDALIIAAAQVGECDVLLTEDLQHGQMLSTVRVVDPFASPNMTPAEVLEALAS